MKLKSTIRRLQMSQSEKALLRVKSTLCWSEISRRFLGKQTSDGFWETGALCWRKPADGEGCRTESMNKTCSGRSDRFCVDDCFTAARHVSQHHELRAVFSAVYSFGSKILSQRGFFFWLKSTKTKWRETTSDFGNVHFHFFKFFFFHILS